jgi:hydroxymethylpyrimidine pyrophosphatase-like HAD family hydrolase
MVAFDLDGTLLQPNHKISNYAVQYLRYLHNKGFIVTIATGRSPAAIAEVIRRLNFDFPMLHSEAFPVVSTNGAKGLHVSHASFNDDDDDEQDSDHDEKGQTNPMVNGEMTVTELFHQPLPSELTQKTLQIAKRMGCTTNYYIGHDVHAQIHQEWNLHATHQYSNLTGVKYTYCEDDYEQAMQIGLPSKLLVLCKPETLDDTVEQLKKELGEEANIIRGSPPFFVEVLNPQVSKGNGLELLCEKLGVKLEECM